MRAWVAVTDKDWCRFLSRRSDLDEVNFWQPDGFWFQIRGQSTSYGRADVEVVVARATRTGGALVGTRATATPLRFSVAR